MINEINTPLKMPIVVTKAAIDYGEADPSPGDPVAIGGSGLAGVVLSAKPGDPLMIVDIGNSVYQCQVTCPIAVGAGALAEGSPIFFDSSAPHLTSDPTITGVVAGIAVLMDSDDVFPKGDDGTATEETVGVAFFATSRYVE